MWGKLIIASFILLITPVSSTYAIETKEHGVLHLTRNVYYFQDKKEVEKYNISLFLDNDDNLFKGGIELYGKTKNNDKFIYFSGEVVHVSDTVFGLEFNHSTINDKITQEELINIDIPCPFIKAILFINKVKRTIYFHKAYEDRNILCVNELSTNVLLCYNKYQI